MAVMGKDEYNKFINSKVNSYINARSYGGNRFNPDEFKTGLKVIGKYKAFHTPFYKFMNEIQDYFILRNGSIEPTLKVAYKYNKKAGTNDRSKMIQCLSSICAFSKQISKADKDAVVEFIKEAIAYEKDDESAKYYGNTIDRIQGKANNGAGFKRIK